jgi:hypothetical protein
MGRAVTALSVIGPEVCFAQAPKNGKDTTVNNKQMLIKMIVDFLFT